MQKKKIWITVILILAALAIGFGIYWYLHQKDGAGKGRAVYVQKVEDLVGASQTAGNRYSGIVETQKTESVQFDTSKTLKKLFVEEGDRVNEDDALFSYDTAGIDLDIQSKELEIERLESTISDERSQIDTLKKDMEKAKDADKLAFSAQIKELQAEVAQNEYTIKTVERDIEGLEAAKVNSTVFAPIDGTVTHVGDPDDPAGSMDFNGMDQTGGFITILADGDLRIKGTVSEQNIYEIGEGVPVIVRSRIDPEQTWAGTVSYVDTQTESNSNEYYGEGERASKYPFYVDLDEPEGLLLGQHVTIELDQGQNADRSGIWLSSGFIIMEDESTDEESSADAPAEDVPEGEAPTEEVPEGEIPAEEMPEGEPVDEGFDGEEPTGDMDYGDDMYDEGEPVDEMYDEGEPYDELPYEDMPEGGSSIIEPEEPINAYVWAAVEGGRLEKRAVLLGAYDMAMDAWEILSGLELSDYIAWPDSNCREGAPTTTEYVFDDEETELNPEEMPEGEDYVDPGFGGGEEFVEPGIDGGEEFADPGIDGGEEFADPEFTDPDEPAPEDESAEG